MACILKGGGGLYSRLVVGAVVLAAGQGSRIGNKPKCLLELAGVPLIKRQIIALSGAGVDEVVVVLGHYAEVIEAAIQELPITIVRQTAEEHTQPESVRLGMRALSSKLDAVMVCPSDMPLLGTQDYVDLVAAYKKRPEGTVFVGPEVNGQPGNPVIFDREVREAIEREEGNYGCGNWRKRQSDTVYHWVTDNRRYITDIDTEDDLARLKAESGRDFVWRPELACV